MRRSSRQRLMTEESVQSSTLHSVLKLLRPRVSAGLLTQEAATLTSTSTTSATTRWLLQTSTTATTILPRNRREIRSLLRETVSSTQCRRQRLKSSAVSNSKEQEISSSKSSFPRLSLSASSLHVSRLQLQTLSRSSWVSA